MVQRLRERDACWFHTVRLCQLPDSASPCPQRPFREIILWLERRSLAVLSARRQTPRSRRTLSASGRRPWAASPVHRRASRWAPCPVNAASGWRLSLPACSTSVCFFMRSLHYLTGERPLHFQLNRNRTSCAILPRSPSAHQLLLPGFEWDLQLAKWGRFQPALTSQADVHTWASWLR